ncbi:MAG: VOC family protein [Chloroflexi bacterium]|nr:VOC family protein [Chloroflexota bacterium]
MIDGIYHIGYWTDDIARAIAMYQTVFGAEVFQEATGADGKTKLAFLHVGQTDVELIQPADQSVLGGQTGLVIHHAGYLVADIEASIAALKAKGVKFAAETTNRTPTGAQIIYLDTASTNGARIHLTQI